MFAVTAVYPSGRQTLIGFANSTTEADTMVAECIAHNGEERLKEMGIRFYVELAI